MSKLRAVILGNEIRDDHRLWVSACRDLEDEIEFRVVDLTSEAWLEEIRAAVFDVLLAKPSGTTQLFKQLYDERIDLLSRVLGCWIHPSPLEIFLYENKRYLYSWLQAAGIPHPRARVFYEIQEALNHARGCALPLVGKTGIGASGSGVRVLASRTEALEYVEQAFSAGGATRRAGPNLGRGGWLRRGFHYVRHPGDIRKKLDLYRAIRADRQTGYVLLQDYVPHEFEWRAVRIGDSFFAHKKLKKGGKASGSLLKEYGAPPPALLDFIEAMTIRHGFRSLAVDVFETQSGYLVNEMQCIFGQSDPYQMLVGGRPGRYLRGQRGWTFEEGDFNRNESYDLRVRYAIDAFRRGEVRAPAAIREPGQPRGGVK